MTQQFIFDVVVRLFLIFSFFVGATARGRYPAVVDKNISQMSTLCLLVFVHFRAQIS